MMYAVVMAGGSGTRLWPRSRESRPKQFHSLTSDRTLLQETIARLDPAITLENTYVIAGRTHVKAIKEQLPDLPDDQIIAEPSSRNTAPAVGIMAVILSRRDPDAIMLVLPADHFIAKADRFRSLINTAEKVIQQKDGILTIGIKPTYPETGYGYIEIDHEVGEFDGEIVYRVASFKEKPDPDTAKEYVASWRYLWNSGMFVWSAKTILELFKKHAPDIYEGLEKFSAALGTPNESAVLHEVYKEFPNISVDYAILEKAENVLVIPADIGWSDIGSWAALHELLSFDEGSNVVIGRHVGIDTHNCLIHGGSRLIATLGLDNMIIVDSDDVLLICPKGRSQDVKRLIDKLRKTGKTEYL